MSPFFLPAVLSDELQRFAQAGEATLNRATVFTADPLYHYTTSASGLSILKNRNIRLTHHEDLQDTYEVNYGRECAEALLLNAERRNPSPVSDFCRVTRQNLQAAFAPFGFYVGSLTTEENGQRHWEDYADQHRGFRIGFAPVFFGHTRVPLDQLKPTEKIVAARVFYGDRTIEYRQRKIIERALSILHKREVQQAIGRQPHYTTFMRELTIHAAITIMFNSLCAKRQSYDFEKEVRLIMLGDRDLLQPHEQQGPPKRAGKQCSRFIPASFEPWPIDIAHIGIGQKAAAIDIAQLHSVIGYERLPPEDQRRIIR